MKYLGVDFGLKHCGLAVSDESGGFAFPAQILQNSKTLASEIFDFCKKENIQAVVIGQSSNEEVLYQSKKLESFLKENGFEVFWQDESLSSLNPSLAKRVKPSARLSGRQGTEKSDSESAAVILQRFLDSK